MTSLRERLLRKAQQYSRSTEVSFPEDRIEQWIAEALRRESPSGYLYSCLRHYTHDVVVREPRRKALELKRAREEAYERARQDLKQKARNELERLIETMRGLSPDPVLDEVLEVYVRQRPLRKRFSGIDKLTQDVYYQRLRRGRIAVLKKASPLVKDLLLKRI